MKWYLKLLVTYIVRNVLRVLCIIPIKKNRILFVSNQGMIYGCNPKYIFEYLYKEDEDYEYVWCLNNKSSLPKQYLERLRCVKFLWPAYLYYLLTSKVVISNLRIDSFFPKRKSQLFIGTWHGGGAYKSTPVTIVEKGPHRFYCKSIRDFRAQTTDYEIVSCEKQIEAYKIDYNIEAEKCLQIGTPRNDMFFHLTPNVINKTREKLSKCYAINPNKKWILYAPTFRRNSNGEILANEFLIDFDKITKAFETRFNWDVVMMYRYHVGCTGIPYDGTDVSDYPDMQDLLIAADAIITDYSSLMWDYSFTYRPGFLYIPDIEEVRTKIHTPVETWPYPYACNESDLLELILRYDSETAKSKIVEHHKYLGSYESGNATSAICTLIKSYLN